MSTDELLDSGRARTPEREEVLKALRGRRSEAEGALLLDALRSADPWRASLAVRVLGERGDTRIIEAAERLVSAEFGIVRRDAWLALAELPTEVALPLARAWRSSGRSRLRWAAQHILIRHATVEDLPWVRAQLRQPITDGRVCAVCNYLEVLARLPDQGPFPEVARVYRELPYSYGRRFAVEVMARADPSFPNGLAFECLWDSEETVRKLACDAIDLRIPGVPKRLRELADARWEDESVREAARTRLEAPRDS